MFRFVELMSQRVFNAFPSVSLFTSHIYQINSNHVPVFIIKSGKLLLSSYCYSKQVILWLAPLCVPEQVYIEPWR